SGKFRLMDLRIDGLHPGDRAFFTAKQIDLAMDWRPAFRRRPEFMITGVELSDWQMLVEKWDGGDNFPKFRKDDDQETGPKRFTTTLRSFRSERGRFAYEDHETPWSIVCPNLELVIANDRGYRGRATFSGGIVRIQDHLPMWTNMRASFALDGPRIQLERIDI